MDYRDWYYMDGETPAGPVSWPRIVELSRASMIGPQTLVRGDGSDDWIYFKDASRQYQAGRERPPSDSGTDLAYVVDPRGWSTGPVAPWRRYGARMLDTTVHAVLGVVIISFAWYSLAPISAEKFFSHLDGPGGAVMDFAISTVAAAIVGGFVVGSTGTSVGKAIFGVRVVDAKFQAIGIGNGLMREFRVWIVGLGLGIPIVTLFTMIIANQKLRKDGTTWWDAGRNLVFYRPNGPFQSGMNVLGTVLIVLVIGAMGALNSM